MVPVTSCHFLIYELSLFVSSFHQNFFTCTAFLSFSNSTLSLAISLAIHRYSPGLRIASSWPATMHAIRVAVVESPLQQASPLLDISAVSPFCLLPFCLPVSLLALSFLACRERSHLCRDYARSNSVLPRSRRRRHIPRIRSTRPHALLLPLPPLYTHFHTSRRGLVAERSVQVELINDRGGIRLAKSPATHVSWAAGHLVLSS